MSEYRPNLENQELAIIFSKNKNLLIGIARKIEANNSLFQKIIPQIKQLFEIGQNVDNFKIDNFEPMSDDKKKEFFKPETFNNTKLILETNGLLPINFDNTISAFLKRNDVNLQNKAYLYLDLLNTYLYKLTTLSQKEMGTVSNNRQEKQETHDFNRIQNTVTDIINKTNVNDKEQTIKDYNQTINNLASLPDGVDEPDYVHDIFANSAVLAAGRDRKLSYVYFFQERLNKNNYDISKFITPSVIRELYSFSTLLICIEKFENVRKQLSIDNPQGKKDAIDKIYKIIDAYNTKLSLQNDALNSQPKTTEIARNKVGFFGTIQGLRDRFNDWWNKK